MKLVSLPNWNKLTKKEKERLKLIFAPRVEIDYNLKGEKSISKDELKRGVENHG